MRDLLILAFTIGGAYYGLVSPWLGVLALVVLAWADKNHPKESSRTASGFIPFLRTQALVQFNGIFRINRPEPFENTEHYRKAADIHNYLILPVFPLN